MGPKVKKGSIGGSSNSNGSVDNKKDLEQVQADYELFLQAFEKPTQIYRYLRTRNLISPIFLHRTLSFMQKKRHCRAKTLNHRNRSEFKVDSLLERKLTELRSSSSLLLPPSPSGHSSYLLLTFLGYYFDEDEDEEEEMMIGSSMEKMNIEVLLVKTSQRVRSSNCNEEDTSLKVPFGVVEVPVNPSEDHPPEQAPVLSLSSDAFRNLDNGLQLQNYTLLFRVLSKTEAKVTNGSGRNKLDDDENTEPLCKRRKSNCLDSDEEESSALSRSADLVIYDKHSKCLLSDGEYEVVLSSSPSSFLSKRSAATNHLHKKNWETLDGNSSKNWDKNPFDAFLSNPTLKFKLSWSSDKTGSLIQRPKPLLPRGDEGNNNRSNGSNRPLNNKNYFSSSSLNNGVKSEKRSDKKKLSPRIVYQFLYNNNSRQQTEARDDLHCPWCSLNCMELYALLKHLKLSHPRFLFTYVPIPEGARIDVSVSELYDSTYVGNPHDMIRQPPGFAFSRRVPTQRTSVTNVIVCKPKRPFRNSLSEFLEIDDNDLNGPYEGQRPFVTGHNRLYHYSTTCLPMPPNAILQPLEEDQVDPPWLMIKICKMLDEFSDVNHGEKEFMKLWNLHVQHHTYVGDIQMGLALEMFIDENVEALISKSLYRNFLLHVANLFDFGVISSTLALQTIVKIQNVIKTKGLSISAHKGLTIEKGLPSPSNSSSSNSSSAIRKDFSGLFNRSSSPTNVTTSITATTSSSSSGGSSTKKQP